MEDSESARPTPRRMTEYFDSASEECTFDTASRMGMYGPVAADAAEESVEAEVEEEVEDDEDDEEEEEEEEEAEVSGSRRGSGVSGCCLVVRPGLLLLPVSAGGRSGRGGGGSGGGDGGHDLRGERERQTNDGR